MSNIEKAKTILKENSELTLVLCGQDTVYKKTSSGIRPMLEFLKDGVPLSDFSAADKIIGKAAALLFAKAKVSEVYGEVLSRAALPVLEKYNIRYSYGVLTDRIINRTNTGLCPIEESVIDIDDKDKAIIAIKNKLELLRKNAE